MGLGVIVAPFAANLIQQTAAEHRAAERQQHLASMERTDLTGRLPRKFVTVGNYSEADTSFIKAQYRTIQFPKEESARLSSVYGYYRSQAFCHTHSSGETLAPNIKIPVCKNIPDTVQDALGLREPVLFFAEGFFSTSHRRSNTLVGDIYEIRLITPTEYLLVDYFDQTTLDTPASIINPYSSGQKLKPGEKAPTRQEFIQAALEGASP